MGKVELKVNHCKIHKLHELFHQNFTVNFHIKLAIPLLSQGVWKNVWRLRFSVSKAERIFFASISAIVSLSTCFLCEVNGHFFQRNKPLRQPAVHRVEAGSVLRGVTFTLYGPDHFRCWILRFHLSFYINCLARWMFLKTLRIFLPSEISSSWKPQVLTFWSCIHWPHYCPVCSGITVWRFGLDQDSWSSSHKDGTKSSPW